MPSKEFESLGKLQYAIINADGTMSELRDMGVTVLHVHIDVREDICNSLTEEDYAELIIFAIEQKDARWAHALLLRKEVLFPKV